MADVASALYSWSTNEASNAPAGATTVGTGWDDNLRMMQKVVRGALATKGADIASAGTTDIGAVEGLFHDITGTTTITGFGTVSAGIWKVLKFEGALTLTHNASSLIIPGGANITTADGDMAMVTSEGSGNWRVNWYVKASGSPLTLTGATITGLSAETSPATDDELAIYDTSEGANNKMTFANFLKVINGLTEDTAPDLASDFVVTYDASASAAKKVAPANLGTSRIFLTKKTLTGGSIQITSADCSFSAYDYMEFVLFQAVPATNGASINVSLSEDAGSSYLGSPNYSGIIVAYDSGGTNRNFSFSGTAPFQLTETAVEGISNSATNNGFNGRLTLWKPSSSVRKQMSISDIAYFPGAVANSASGNGSCLVVSTAAVTGIKFAPTTGNWTSGTIAVYGHKTS